MENHSNPRPMTGHVKWFDTKKDFGFVVSMDGGPDILLHGNVLRNFGQNSIFEGSLVEVLVKSGGHGLLVCELLSQQPPENFSSKTLVEAEELSLKDLENLPIKPGRVKWYDRGKGFGFAQLFGSPDDVFIKNNILHRAGLDDLAFGEAIGIRCNDSDRGKCAVQVLAWC